MKIEMLESVQTGQAVYEQGQVYDFPEDVALRWITRGKARKSMKKEPVKESS